MLADWLADRALDVERAAIRLNAASRDPTAAELWLRLAETAEDWRLWVDGLGAWRDLRRARRSRRRPRKDSNQGPSTVTENPIRYRVIEAIAKRVHEPRDLIEDGLLLSDLGFDSLDAVETAMELEAELAEEGMAIEIVDAEVEAVKTVGDLVRLIAGKVVAKGET